MNEMHKKITAAIAEFVFLSVLALSVPLILSVDIFVMGHGIHEISLTELTQEALVLVCALRFLLGACCRPQSRGFLVLVAGFFFCILVRELDGFLDKLVFHGFWVWPATLLALGTIVYAIRCRGTILAPMADFVGTRSYFSILFGLVILLVFSRSFGSGGLLWKQVMGDDYRPLFKATLQEGLELLAYLFITYGTFRFPRIEALVNAEHGSTQEPSVGRVGVGNLAGQRHFRSPATPLAGHWRRPSP